MPPRSLLERPAIFKSSRLSLPVGKHLLKIFPLTLAATCTVTLIVLVSSGWLGPVYRAQSHSVLTYSGWSLWAFRFWAGRDSAASDAAIRLHWDARAQRRARIRTCPRTSTQASSIQR